jgi:hypothetical protein
VKEHNVERRGKRRILRKGQVKKEHELEKDKQRAASWNLYYRCVLKKYDTAS